VVESEVLDMAELCRKYPQRWVAARVLAREEEGGQPTSFEVIAANADLYAVRLGLGKNEYCIIYTGSVPEEKYVPMY
jgi:hypothetical protein